MTKIMAIDYSFIFNTGGEGTPLSKKDIPTPEEAREQFEDWKKYLKKVAIAQEEEAKKATVWISQ